MTQHPISEEPNAIGKKTVLFFFLFVNLRLLIINFFFNQSLFTSYERSIAVISKMKNRSLHPHLVSFSSSGEPEAVLTTTSCSGDSIRQ